MKRVLLHQKSLFREKYSKKSIFRDKTLFILNLFFSEQAKICRQKNRFQTKSGKAKPSRFLISN